MHLIATSGVKIVDQSNAPVKPYSKTPVDNKELQKLSQRFANANMVDQYLNLS